jgi:hypothetical protein
MNKEKMTLLLHKANRKGLKLFSYHVPTGSLKVQEYTVKTAEDGSLIGYETIIDEGCIYVLALNKDNAIKKLKKIAHAVKANQ